MLSILIPLTLKTWIFGNYPLPLALRPLKSALLLNVNFFSRDYVIIFDRVDIFVRQQWTEPRLIMPEDIFEEGDDYVTLPPEFFDNLWQPDPYILNSKISGNYDMSGTGGES